MSVIRWEDPPVSRVVDGEARVYARYVGDPS